MNTEEIIASAAANMAAKDAKIARLRQALKEAAESFNKIAGAALRLQCKPAFAEAITGLDAARAALNQE